MHELIFRIKILWHVLKPRTQAALKTAAQTMISGFLAMVLALTAALSTSLSGLQPIDLVQAASIAAVGFMLTVLGALSGFVSFLMNRNSGIHYK
jgi:TRAP-type C4-dicarboxylate transport system permease small subunit